MGLFNVIFHYLLIIGNMIGVGFNLYNFILDNNQLSIILVFGGLGAVIVLCLSVIVTTRN